MSPTPEGEVLSAPNIIEYPFSRTTGPVIGAFITGLREGVVLGIKASDGRVLVPPPEYDADTAEALTELVEVGDEGEVLDLGVGRRAARQPPARPPVRLGARPPRRRRLGPAARGRRRRRPRPCRPACG